MLTRAYTWRRFAAQSPVELWYLGFAPQAIACHRFAVQQFDSAPTAIGRVESAQTESQNVANRDGQLETLMRYRENIRDQYRQLMAQLLAEGRRLDADQTRLQLGHDEGLRVTAGSEALGKIDVTQSVGRRQHAAHQRDQIIRLQRQIDLNGQHMEMCRESLTQADQDVQALEKLQEKRQREFAAKTARKTQFELEDAWAGAQATGM